MQTSPSERKLAQSAMVAMEGIGEIEPIEALKCPEVFLSDLNCLKISECVLWCPCAIPRKRAQANANEPQRAQTSPPNEPKRAQMSLDESQMRLGS